MPPPHYSSLSHTVKDFHSSLLNLSIFLYFGVEFVKVGCWYLPGLQFSSLLLFSISVNYIFPSRSIPGFYSPLNPSTQCFSPDAHFYLLSILLYVELLRCFFLISLLFSIPFPHNSRLLKGTVSPV
jgi:hypothetical protein